MSLNSEGFEYRETISQTEIEPAALEDVEQILQVWKQASLETYPNEERSITEADIASRDYESEKQFRGLKDIILDPAHRMQVWTAKNDGKVVGFAIGSKLKGHTLSGMYTLSEYYGKSIGPRLMEKVLDWLGDDEDISLEVAEYTPRAINFYEKFGFIRTNERRNGNFPSGASIPYIKMVRPAKEQVAKDENRLAEAA